VRRNRSKIDLCGPKSVHDYGDGISNFVTQDSTDLFLNRYMVNIVETSVKMNFLVKIDLFGSSDDLFAYL